MVISTLNDGLKMAKSSEEKLRINYAIGEKLKETDVEKALNIFKEIEKNDTENFISNSEPLFSAIGDIYLYLKEYDLANFYYSKEINNYPNYYYGYYKRADLYTYQLKDFESAKTDYEKAIELDPENNNLNLSYINLLFLAKDYKSVLEMTDESNRKDNKDAQSPYMRSKVYMKKDDQMSALFELNECIEKIEKYSNEGYWIQDTNGEELDLSVPFIERAKILFLFNQTKKGCETLELSKSYTNSKEQISKINSLIDSNCNN